MADAEQVNKLEAFAKNLKNRSIVKDSELQIFVPQNAQDAGKLEGKYSFKDMLGKLYSDVNALQHDADAQIQRLVAGETENLHEVTQAMDEAETSFELMMNIHKKLIEAYEKIQNL